MNWTRRCARLSVTLVILTAACAANVHPDEAADVDASIDANESTAPDVATPCTFSGSAPRPIGPISTSHVSTRRPLFRWRRAAPGDVRVELCSNRDCAGVVAGLNLGGTEERSPMRIEPGTHYWRLRERCGTQVADQASAVWQINVGRADADVAGAWGTSIDLNGDGIADALVDLGLSAGGYVGRRSGLGSQPDFVVGGDAGSLILAATAGDTNGDGVVEIATWENRHSGVILRTSTEAGIRGPPVAAVRPPELPASSNEFGPAGDFDGDGYGDVLLIAHDRGAVFVYWGSASGASDGSRTELPMGGFILGMSARAFGAGDANGDGISDIAVGCRNRDEARIDSPDGTAVLLFLGRGSRSLTAPDGIYPTGPYRQSQNLQPMWVGDTNGDGRSDLALIRRFTAADLHVFLGAPSGIAPMPTWTVPVAPPPNLWPISDVNGDGFDDVLVTRGFDTSIDALLLPGSPTGPRTGGGAISLAGLPYAPMYASGDFNADGFDDVIGQAGDMARSVALHAGFPGGLHVSERTLTYDGRNAMGFVVLASNSP